jgi:predicted small metal-binding protein
MDREIGCECGFVARGGDTNKIVAQAQEHARTVHHMDFSAHQLLSLVRPAADDGVGGEPRKGRNDVQTDHPASNERG